MEFYSRASVFSAFPKVAASNVERQSLPPRVQAVIQHRLRQLSSAAREVASLAAVGGRSFTFATLAHASDLGEAGLACALDELWQRRIIREQELNAYDFSHDKLRDVAYSEKARLAATCNDYDPPIDPTTARDFCIRLWDLETGKEVRRLPGTPSTSGLLSPSTKPKCSLGVILPLMRRRPAA